MCDIKPGSIFMRTNNIIFVMFLCLMMANSSINADQHEFVEVEENAEEEAIIQADIVLIGASYLHHWELEKLSCASVYNVGIDGNQSTDMKNRFNQDAVALKPKGVVIWGFINDLHSQPKEDIAQTVSQIKNNFKLMVEQARRNDVVPVLVTEVTIAESKSLKWQFMSWLGELRGKQSYQKFINSNVMSINKWLREYASDNNLTILDFEQLLINDEGSRLDIYAQADGSHLTKSAYRLINRFARRILLKELIDGHNFCL